MLENCLRTVFGKVRSLRLAIYFGGNFEEVVTCYRSLDIMINVLEIWGIRLQMLVGSGNVNSASLDTNVLGQRCGEPSVHCMGIWHSISPRIGKLDYAICTYNTCLPHNEDLVGIFILSSI